MPYRRLPNTDAARNRALRIALEKGKKVPPFKLAFSQQTYQRILSFLPSYEKALAESQVAYKNQVEKNREYIRVMKKAKMYISHFIQVINLANIRGDLQDTEREYFGLTKDKLKTPSLNSENDIMIWGKKLIEGEEIRKSKGLSPITNPTMAVVRVRYEQFVDAFKFQKTLQRNNNRALDNLANMRDEADQIILAIWNEVENTFNELPSQERRTESSEYGVVYVYRKNELQEQQGRLNF